MIPGGQFALRVAPSKFASREHVLPGNRQFAKIRRRSAAARDQSAGGPQQFMCSGKESHVLRRISVFIIQFSLGAAAMFAAFSYHVVRSDDGFLLVPRHQAGIDRAYVDIRKWTVGDWVANRDVAQALIDHGRTDLIKPLNPGQVLEDVLRQLDQRPASTGAPQRR
jgi:hypothetical protein